MTTVLRALAALSVLATATPAFAHTRHDVPRHARDFEAVSPYPSPNDEPRGLPFSVDEESHPTATGGPVGGLIDRN